ncbi:MAG: hypothetical protein WC983_02805 [Tissierellaceae bacterium]
MIRDLLLIAQNLLYSLSIVEFSESEKEYITSVVRRLIELSLAEIETK